ncbi:UTP-glucose-1-phosphate uridylyltransferase [Acrasis kona]|uniref:UTP-glucose-1-phosphate uridylyltransferase n=1 Tax=Acrasis kona TaxID=1008807 RepID=A0AAW2ZSA3_9EUKA
MHEQEGSTEQKDGDIALKKEWENNPITDARIKNVLDKIQDREWSMQQSLKRIAPKEETNKNLILRGIEDNSSLLKNSTPQFDFQNNIPSWDQLTEVQRQLINTRMQLFERLTKIELFSQICDDDGIVFTESSYKSFAIKSLVEIGIQFSGTREWTKLDHVLCQIRDPKQKLTVLKAIPLSTPVIDYVDVLPFVKNDEITSDWSSAESHDFSEKYIKKEKASPIQFYVSRARDILNLVPSYASDFIKEAIEKGVPESAFIDIQKTSEQVNFLVYDAGVDVTDVITFESLSQYGRVALLRGANGGEEVKYRLKKFPQPYETIRTYVQKLIDADQLEECVAVFESRILKGDHQIKLALDTIQNIKQTGNDDYVDRLEDIIKCASNEKTKDPTLESALSGVQSNIEALSIMSRYGVNLPISSINDFKSDEKCKKVIHQMIQHCIKTKANAKAFQDLYFELIELRGLLMTQIPMLHIWNQYLLNCYLLGHLDLVDEFIQQGELTRHEVDEIALEAVQQLINAVSSPQDYNLSLALKIMNHNKSKELQFERQLIDLYRTSCRHFDKCQLPIQSRESLKDARSKMNVILYLLQNNPRIDIQHISMIGELLHLNDKLIRFTIADFCFHQKKDYKMATLLMKELVEQNYAASSRLCFEICKIGFEMTIHQKLEFMNFVILNLEPSNDLSQALQLYKNLELEKISNELKNDQENQRLTCDPFYYPSPLVPSISTRPWKLHSCDVNLIRQLSNGNEMISDLLPSICKHADLNLLITTLPKLKNDIFKDWIESSSSSIEYIFIAHLYHMIQLNRLNVNDLTHHTIQQLVQLSNQHLNDNDANQHVQSYKYYSNLIRMMNEVDSIQFTIDHRYDINARRYLMDSNYRSEMIHLISDCNVELAIELAITNQIDADAIYSRRITSLLKDSNFDRDSILQLIRQTTNKKQLKDDLIHFVMNGNVDGLKFKRFTFHLYNHRSTRWIRCIGPSTC